MSTPNSAATSYLAAAQLLSYYDVRTIGDLCSDTGSRLSVQQIVGPPVNAVVQQLLNSAAGMIEAAAGVGARYQASDLEALTGVSQAFLWQLNADLFIGLAIRRRPDRKIPVPPQVGEALEWLEQLRQGERVFSLLEVQQAGLPSTYQETAADVFARDLVVTQARRFFGRRVDQDCGFPTS